MSWLFSQALVEEYLGDTCLDGEQSVQSSGNPTQQAYCAPDKMTKFSRLSRFGMMFRPLTETRGEELLTLYLADFHARTLAQQEKVQELQAADPQCGNTWRASLAKYDHSTSMWKTAQCSLLEDSMSFSLTLPRWGLMQDGALYPQQTLVQTISVKEFGSEPNNDTFFHTPCSTGMDGGSNSRKALKKRLEWATPNTLEGLAPKKLDRIMEYNNKSRPGRSYASMNLREQVVYGKIPIWPTPQARDHKGSSGRSNTGQELDLPTKVKLWPTPATRDYKGANSFKTTQEKLLQGKQAHTGQLPNAIMMEKKEDIGGTLNPTWVEWLMGWPLGWTDLKPLEMDKYQKWQEQHGVCLNKNL